MIVRRLPAPLACLLGLSLALAACGGSNGGPSPSPNEPSTAPATDAPATDAPAASPTPAPASPSAPVGAPPTATDAPAHPLLTQTWALAELTDVATGETFRIADLAATADAVLIEPMAIWCTNCRRQQAEVKAALAEIDGGGLEYVVLTVEPSETAEGLAAYRSQNGFEGRYAVAGTAVAAALAADFGPTVLLPPTVPKLLIRDGQVEFLSGHHDAAEILELVGE